MSQETIFISIASYQDDMLKLTIADALSKAKYPDRLKFGVVEQREAARRINPSVSARKYMRYVGVEPEDSRGVCWARAVAMTLYQNEDWYFQVDSHMLFEQDWDVWFVDKTKALELVCDKPIISGYPHSFWFEKNVPIKESNQYPRVHGFCEPAKFEDNALIVFTSANVLKAEVPIKAWHMAAGCLFTRGHFVNEIPYDPQIYFEGEETSIALRAFTNGWDTFHMPGMPIYHLWRRERRVAHWECESDKKRHENWASLKINSLSRLRKVLSGKLTGIYGVGSKRSLKDYAEFCGVDYENETINTEVFTNKLPKE